jgi:hypothetical protein
LMATESNDILLDKFKSMIKLYNLNRIKRTRE